MSLKILRLHNWTSFRFAEIQFPNNGIMIITGKTGSGKTSIMDAVRFLLGSNLRRKGKRWDDYITSGFDASYVEGVFEKDGETIVLRRALKKGSAPKYYERIVENGKVRYKNIKVERAKEILESLGMPDPDNIFIFADSYHVKLIASLNSHKLLLFLEEGIIVREGIGGDSGEVESVSLRDIKLRIMDEKNKLKVKDAEIDRHKAYIEKLKKEKYSLESKMSRYMEKRKLLDRLKELAVLEEWYYISQKEEQLNRLKKELKSAERRKRELIASNKSLSEKYNELTEKKEELLKEITEKNRALEEIKKKREEILSRIQEGQGVINGLNRSKASFEEDTRRKKEEINRIESEIESLKGDLEKLDEEHSKTIKELKEKNSKLEELTETINKAKEILEKIHNKEKAKKDYDKNAKTLEKEIIEARKELRDLENKIRTLNDQAEALQKLIDQSEIERDKIECERERVRKELEDITVEISKREGLIKGITEQIKALEERLSSITRGENYKQIYDELQQMGVTGKPIRLIIEEIMKENKDLDPMLLEAVIPRELVNAIAVTSPIDAILALDLVKEKEINSPVVVVKSFDSLKKKILSSYNKTKMIDRKGSMQKVLSSDKGLYLFKMGEKLFRVKLGKMRVISPVIPSEEIKRREIERSLNELRRRLNSEKREKIKLKGKLTDLRRKLEHIEEVLNASKKLSRILQDLENYRKARLKLRNKLKSKKEALENYRKLISNIESEIQQLKEQFPEKGDIASLQSKRQSLKEDIKKLRLKERELYEKKVKMENKIKAAQDRIKSIEKDISILNEKIGEIEKEIQEILSKNEELKKEIDPLNLREEELKNEINALEYELDQVKIELTHVENQRSSNIVELQGLNDKIRRLINDIQDLSKEIESKKVRLGERPSLIPSITSIRDEAMRIRARLDSEFSDVPDILPELIENKVREIEMAEKLLEKIIREKELMSKKLDELTNVYINKLRNTIKEIEKKINEVFRISRMPIECKFDLIIDPNDLASNKNGIEVKVKLMGADFKSVQSLSEGQKTLVFVGLIVTLHKMYNSPIYMYDELVINLDEENVKNVGNILGVSAKNSLVTLIFMSNRSILANLIKTGNVTSILGVYRARMYSNVININPKKVL